MISALMDSGCFMGFIILKTSISAFMIFPTTSRDLCLSMVVLIFKTQSGFKCVVCGHEANADHNTAKNILAAGLAVFVCGGCDISQSMKQEPTVPAIEKSCT